jgi:hypothetical protein
MVGNKVRTLSPLFGLRTMAVVRYTKTRIILQDEDGFERAYRMSDGFLVGTKNDQAERILGDDLRLACPTI